MTEHDNDNPPLFWQGIAILFCMAGMVWEYAVRAWKWVRR